jgi:site-specific DNA recombinase
MQREAITRAAAARGEPVDVWLEESASAATMARPELARLRHLARAGELRLLYVFRLDRLCRSGIRDLLGLIEELSGHGCQVESIADGFSLRGAGGEIVAAVLGWAAQMERLALGERIAAARVRVEAKGGTWGRARRMTDELAEKALVMRVKGKHSIRYISSALKVPRATLARELSRRLKNLNPDVPKNRPEKPGIAKVLAPMSR